MDVEDIVPPHIVPHLPNGLQEGQALDVADRPADLRYDYIGPRFGGQSKHPVFDGVGDMGHGLNGATKEVAAALFGYKVEIDFSGGEIGGPGKFDVDESFVVPQVQVSLAAVLGHEDFAVLIGGHGAGIDVEVGVQLDYGDGYSSALQDASDGCDADPFA